MSIALNIVTMLLIAIVGTLFKLWLNGIRKNYDEIVTRVNGIHTRLNHICERLSYIEGYLREGKSPSTNNR